MTGTARIMECTLRDGSYAIDYQFTTEDSAIIAKGLENAGFEFIEFGHGLGLNASNAGEGIAAATDEEYLRTISSTITRAKYGMFFIPGIGREKDLRLAAKYGMDFVRIGINATDIQKTTRYIRLAKKLDMIVFVNLMKSYVLPPKDIADNAVYLEQEGTDYVYIVDSAGGMLQQDIRNYIGAIREKTGDIRIGFHGHNNLSLALANSLVAIESGATIVDSCLQGIGRSAGNTPTEILVMVLERMGYTTGIDSEKTLDLGQKLIQPLMHKKGIDPIEITSGYAQFHSKYLTNVLKYASMYGADPRELIRESSKRNRIEVSEELLESIIKSNSLQKRRSSGKKPVVFNNIDLKPQLDNLSLDQKTRKISAELLSLSKKTGKKSIFTISLPTSGTDVVFPFIRENSLCVIGNCEVSTPDQIRRIVETIDGVVDIIVADADKKIDGRSLVTIIRDIVRKSLLITYKDTDSWARAADVLISQMVPTIQDTLITVFGCNTPSIKLARLLEERGAQVTLWDMNEKLAVRYTSALNTLSQSRRYRTDKDKTRASTDATVLVGFTSGIPVITKKMIMSMDPEGLVIDAGIGSIEKMAIRYSVSSGRRLYRLDMRAGLSGEITTILETKQLIEKIAGKTRIDGVPVVAGGLIGAKGTIVIDSITGPQRVVGIADGAGGIIKDPKSLEKYRDSVERVRMGILTNRLQ